VPLAGPHASIEPQNYGRVALFFVQFGFFVATYSDYASR